MSRFGVDVGGTFTDIAALRDDGTVAIAKTRSARGAVADRVWSALGALGGGDGHALIHGTTVATNALLERTGGRVVLVTTAGFEDLLWLRRQDRAGLYDLSAQHPPPVVERDDVVGVAERMGPDGVLTAISEQEIARALGAVRARGPEAIAVAFLFSFRDPTHERRMTAALRAALPDVSVAASHEVLPVFREYERLGTTAAEAYLRPKVSGYLRRMGGAATAHGFPALRVMASNGGTLSLDQACERAAALALSGPAGGVEGARLVGAEVGVNDLLTLDMGGTSADASIIVGGTPLAESAGSIGGVPLALPHVLIETVGAGGGSVAWVDAGGALKVGPRSAGAEPGPACYGMNGEEATVTDAAVVLGWLRAEHPLASDLALDPALAERALRRVAGAAGLTLEQTARGVIEVANAAMVRALRRVSVERGVDPRGMTLVAFGGAGPMFACRMAGSLGMRRALVPPYAGVLSALGLAAAPEKLEFAQSVHRTAAELDAGAVREAFGPMEAEAATALADAQLVRLADCRYPGQGYEVTVPIGTDGTAAARAFHAAHRDRFGHADEARPVEIVNLRLVAARLGRGVRLRRIGGSADRRIEAGQPLVGPQNLSCDDCTVRIESGWRASVHETGALLLEAHP